MAEKTRLRDQIKQEMRRIIAEQSDAITIVDLYEPYRHLVPKTTFYRWFREVRGAKVPVDILEAVRADLAPESDNPRSHTGDAGITGETLGRDLLGTAPSVAYMAGAGRARIDYIHELGRTLAVARKIESWASEFVGPEKSTRPRNPKLALAAQKNVVACILAVAKVQDDILNLERMRQFHRTVFDRVATRDPKLVREIIDDVHALTREWGMDSAGFV